MGSSAWRLWCCCCGFASSGHGIKGNVCCCSVKIGQPTAVPGKDFWKGDNDKCDCNLICCGLQSRSNVAPISASTQPAGQAYTQPPVQQQMPPVVTGHPVNNQPGVIQDPVKPGKAGYPAVA